MKLKRAGFLTKVVVLALLIGLSVTLLDLHGQLRSAQARKDALETRIQSQSQVNADLSDAVGNSGDPERQQDIGRSAFGLVVPGEVILKVTD